MEGTRIIQTPIRAPRANAYAEHWVRIVQTECLDHLLILSRRHFDRVLTEYVGHYNRPGRIGASISRRPRDERSRAHRPRSSNPPERVLGGLIHEYEVAAA